MISRLAGQVAEVDGQQAVIDCGGIGFAVAMARPSLERLRAGTAATLWVHTQLAKEGVRLFGFLDAQAREAFVALTSVSGVGPRLALAVLSDHLPAELAEIVAAGDLDALRRVPGVGRRTAERILVELRDRLDVLLTPLAGAGAAAAAAPAKAVLGDLVSALVNVGFAPSLARRAARRAVAEGAPGEATGDLLRRALKLSAAADGGHGGA